MTDESRESRDKNRACRARLVSALEALETVEPKVQHDGADARATARRLAHSLRNTGGCGMNEVAEAAARLEDAISADQSHQDLVTDLVAAVRKEVTFPGRPCGETILIVEDEPEMQEVIADALAPTGWCTIPALTVAEALRVLSEREISLVILDLRLPDGDGRDVLAQIRSDPVTASLPVVVTSGELGNVAAAESLALGADACVPKPFDPAVLAATAARILSRHAESERRIRVDALTGLPNRTAFEETFQRTLAHRNRTGDSFSVAIADLDGFKAINDTHGHRVGDEVLRWFAHTLVESLRSSDIVARWGGDEFVVLLPQASERGALQAFEHCLNTIQGRPFKSSSGDLTLPVYFSVGVILVDGPTTLEQVLEVADRRLYRTKSTNRLRLLPRTGAFLRPSLPGRHEREDSST